MVKPATLSTTARAILNAASERDDRHALPPERLPVAAQRAVVRSMLSAGLLELAPAEDDHPAWHTAEDGERQALWATAAGLAAVIAANAGQTEIAPDVSSEVASAPASQDEPTAVAVPLDTQPSRTIRLRAAAAAVLAAWDDPPEDRPTLPSAIRALRASLAPTTARKERPAQASTRLPRTDTKQATVLGLLRRPEVASGPQMAEATGWAPHTARGFLAGLAKRGINVTVLERVRQVGSGSQGAKGSDPAPWMPSVISRIRSLYAPRWGGLQRLPV